MAKVQIGFRAILGDEDFTVLEWAHRAGIDVDVRIEFGDGDFKAAIFKNRRQRRSGNTFPQGRHHAAGDKDEFCH